LLEREKTILSCGGGAILRDATRDRIKSCRGVVWLKASVETIHSRVSDDQKTADRRPNRTNSGGRTEIEEVLAARTPLYAECATLEVDTEDKAPAEIAEEILGKLGLVS
ncbi:MAG: shikimate kinase, partial [Lacipirellulaceae bacterium]